VREEVEVDVRLLEGVDRVELDWRRQAPLEVDDDGHVVTRREGWENVTGRRWRAWAVRRSLQRICGIERCHSIKLTTKYRLMKAGV
jgi:hypothetical protein